MMWRHNLWHNITLSMPPPNTRSLTLNMLHWAGIIDGEIVLNMRNVEDAFYYRQFRVDSDEFWLIIINSAGVGGSGREQQILRLSGIYPGEINSDLAYTGSKDQPHRLSSKYLTRLRVLWYWDSASNFKDSSLLLIGIVWSLSGIFRCVLAVFVFGCNRLECDYSEYSPVSREGILIKFQLQQIVHQIGSGARDACPQIINQSPSF